MHIPNRSSKSFAYGNQPYAWVENQGIDNRNQYFRKLVYAWLLYKENLLYTFSAGFRFALGFVL